MTEPRVSTAAQTRGVVVRDVTKVYRPSNKLLSFLLRSPIKEEVHALNGISFSVPPGEICAVVGPNGAGKSTTFRILIGLTTATTGSAQIMGLDCETESLEIRRLIGWMPSEDRSLIMRLSCADNLIFHGQLQGLSGAGLRKRIQETLDLVGIGHRAKDSVFSLSSGMRARLQLARSLLHRPKVLILDEPTATVDPIASYELIETLKHVATDEDISILISSHRLDEIEALHSHIILLEGGAIKYDGDLDALREVHTRPRVQLEFRTPEATSAASNALATRGVLEIDAETELELGGLLAQDIELGDVVAVLPAEATRSLVTIREEAMPLRDLLAAVYQKDQP
ncbi:MAG: ABC transporter ATP-binding protein [Acidimicrobiia bacterium]|nr:ABC transporter ATP-binding protein [Acidimicrobiia bacterium]MDH4306499.1 ABC transporter ATP-binding protein [Acidimicrobiia bacterium]MDH5292655.1 ABC transporter ATP-binding protein [Acidimicrobiia bacterium]